MNNTKFGFIGGGNMAEAIIGGLLKSGAPAKNLCVSDIDASKLEATYGTLGIHTSTDNSDIVERSDVVLLAVKPQVMKSVLQPVAAHIADRRPLLLSIAAGIRIALLHKWSVEDAAIVRAMPNTPALVSAGAAGLFANKYVSEAQCQLAQAVMQAVGVAVWVQTEDLIDSVTAVSGSGPAYFFYLIEALEAAAVENGLSKEAAQLLSRETALGAAKLALQSEFSAAELRRRVTSPGGTTAAAIETLTQGQFADTLKRAVSNAASRARELAKMAESN